MGRSSIAFASLVSISSLLSAVAWADVTGTQAGTAGGIHGEVQVAKADYAPPQRQIGRQIGSGEPIYMGDQIATGAGAGLQVMLLDQTILTLGQNAKMTVDDMVYDPKSGSGKLGFNVVQGAFRFVSGQIAKNNPENVEIKTPLATIGIRGTIVGGDVSPTSTLIALLGPGAETDTSARHGAIVVSTPAGSVDIGRSGYATEITPGQPPSSPQQATPQQLARVGQATASGASSSSGAATAAPSTTVGQSPVSAAAASGETTAVGNAFATMVAVSQTVQQAADPRNKTSVSDQKKAEETQVIIPIIPDAPVTPTATLAATLAEGTTLTLNQGSSFVTASMDSYYNSISRLDSGNGTATLTGAADGSLTLTSDTVGTVTLPSGVTVSDVDFAGSYNYSSEIYTVGFGHYKVDLYSFGASQNLTYANYGLWAYYTNDGDWYRQEEGAFATGVPTPARQMPSSGSATYRGGTAGVVSLDSRTAASTFTGTSTLIAVFSSNTITGSLTNLTTLNGGTLNNILFSGGTISGNSFAGSAASSATAGTVNTTGATGSFAGGFYGTSAAELAGTYSLSGGNTKIIGAFGGKK